MKRRHGRAVGRAILSAAGIALVLAGCGTTRFVSTWKNPAAAPVGKAQGQVIIAGVAVEDLSIRRAAEDALAAELTKRGLKGVPSYTVLPSGVKEESQAKEAFEKIGATAVVVMRPVRAEQEVTATPMVHPSPHHRGFWGDYYGRGWNQPYSTAWVQTDTVITVETLLFSLDQNMLIWSGQSKTTNPSEVGSFVRELVDSAAGEMARMGVFE